MCFIVLNKENTETCIYIYIYACMYVCMYVCMYIYIYIYAQMYFLRQGLRGHADGSEVEDDLQRVAAIAHGLRGSDRYRKFTTM